MIYITGDTHGSFSRVREFCVKMNTSQEDILIILGDAGINYNGLVNDYGLKKKLSKLPITLFCIHGNHELRPQSLFTYEEKPFCGALAYIEEEFPNLVFGKDGEVYEFNGYQCLVIGGAYSVDKHYRLAMGYKWFSDEQPSDEIKAYVQKQLAYLDYKVDVVLSHTTPYNYMPREMFLSGVDQNRVDNSTELWLQEIENQLTYQKWYCGHFHCEKKIDKIEIKFENIDVFMFPNEKKEDF